MCATDANARILHRATPNMAAAAAPAGADAEVCAVCLDDLHAHGHTRLPGCEHAFHVHCMLTWVQYDPRCPVCRALPAGVVARPKPAVHALATVMRPGADAPGETVVIDLTELDTAAAEERRARQRYTARRRRALRADPRLADDFARLEAMRREMEALCREGEREYERRCRETWRTDPRVLEYRRAYAALRRRERTLARRVDAALSARIGEPV